MMAYRSITRRALAITQAALARSTTNKDTVERKLRTKRKIISDIADVERRYILAAQANALRKPDAWKADVAARLQSQDWEKTTGKIGAKAVVEITKLERQCATIDANIDKLDDRIAKIQEHLDTALEIPSGEDDVEAFFRLTRGEFESTVDAVVVQIGPEEDAHDAERTRAQDDAAASSIPSAKGETPESKFAAMIMKMILESPSTAPTPGPNIDLNYPPETFSRGAAIIDH
jgi:hypothetical protein